MDRLQMMLEQARATSGLTSEQAARRATLAVTRALVAVLPPAEGASVASLRDALVALDEADAAAGPRQAVAAALELDEERAQAIAEAVIVAALEALGDRAGAVAAALPEALRPGAAQEVAHVSHPHRVAPPEEHTLAAGRPGSRNALADADATRAQRHSVVTSGDPHADSRLSSAHELVPDGQTLADGKPGSKRPVSG